jgi:hypothetical protein
MTGSQDDSDSAAKTNRLRRIFNALGFRDGILFIPLAALLATAPTLIHGVSCGHDFGFHLVSWFEVQRSWSQGVLYPHWAQSPDWGAGEPRFVFYPPLTWALGAALGSILPWNWVPALLIFLCLALAGFATRGLARQFLPAPNATLAGALAAATPYALFTAYERSAFAELAATGWIPLLLHFALRQTGDVDKQLSPFGRACDGSATPLAMVLALCWQTNAPAGVMASYLLAFTAFVAAIVLRAWWPLLRGVLAAVIGLGLAAFFLVPAALEQRWIAIRQAVDVGMRVADSWLFARHASPDLALHDQVLFAASTLLVLTTLLAAAGFFVAFRGHVINRTSRRYWIPLVLLIPGILLLQLPISAPIWNLLPQLQFLQFPWRWLAVLGTPFAIFLAAATPLGTVKSRRITITGWAAVLLIFVSLGAHFFQQECDDEDKISNQIAVFQSGSGVDGTDEYAPAASDNSLVASGLPDGCLVSDPATPLGESDSDSTPAWFSEQGSCDATYTASLWQPEYKRLEIDSDEPGFVILRLRRYPAWQVLLNGQSAPAAPPRADGLLVVPVPAGTSTVEIRWGTTPDVLHGRLISAIALLLLLALFAAERLALKPSAVRLS